MKNILKPLPKSVLIPLGLTAAAAAAAAAAVDAAIHNKIFESGRPSCLALRTTTLIISNEEINVIMRIVRSLKEFGLLIKGDSKTIKNEAKNKKEDFLEF